MVHLPYSWNVYFNQGDSTKLIYCVQIGEYLFVARKRYTSLVSAEVQDNLTHFFFACVAFLE